MRWAAKFPHRQPSAKLIAFGFIGFAIGPFMPLALAMIAASAAGSWVTAMALRLLWSAVRGEGHI